MNRRIDPEFEISNDLDDDIEWAEPDNSSMSGTYRGKVVRAENFSDTAMMERVFGSK